MDRTSNFMEGDVVSDVTTPTPKQTRGEIFFQDTTLTSTNGGPFRGNTEVSEKYGETYVGSNRLDSQPQTRGQKTTATHRRIKSAPWFPMQRTMSSLYLAQGDQYYGATQRIQSSPMRLSTQLLNPARGVQVREMRVGTQDDQSVQEPKGESPQQEDTQHELASSPFAPLTPGNVLEIGAQYVMTQKQRSATLSSEATSSETTSPSTTESRSLSRLEKEIASYNEDGLNKKEQEPELVQKIFQDTGMRRTRANIIAVTSLAKGEVPPAPKNLALENFFPSPEETEENTPEETNDDSLTNDAVSTDDTELEDIECYEEMDSEAEVEVSSRKTTHRTRSSSNHQTAPRKSPRAEMSSTQKIGQIIRSGGITVFRSNDVSWPLAMQPKKVAQLSSSKNKTPSRRTKRSMVNIGSLSAPSPAESNRIREILAAPGYSPATTGSHITYAQPQPFQVLNDIPAGYSWRMDSDIHVFEPTRSVFEDFQTFLKVVEEIAGREVGVVKVIVPPLMVPSIEENEKISTNQLVPTQRFEMSKMKTTPDSSVVYNVMTTQYGFESADPHIVEDHSRAVSETWNAVKGLENRMRKEASFGTLLMEKNIVTRLTSGVLASTDLDESLGLRQSLRIRDLQLSKLPGNRLLKSNSVVPGVHSSKINVCRTEGVPVPMHCKHDATYSINYLHKGAPMYWTIVKPALHMDLEGTVDILTAGEAVPSIGIQKPAFPPECDNFIAHRALYLPSETLDTLMLECKQVVQHENEMIITFPFAYRQGFSTGPNVTEEVSYASSRWDIFAKEALHRQCSPSCPGGGSRMDLEFVQSSQGRVLGHKRTSTANQITPSKKSRGDKVNPPASKRTATPRGDTSGRGSETKQTASNHRKATKVRRNLTPTPTREAMEEKEALEGVEKLFARFK